MPDVHVEANDFWMPRGLPVLTSNNEWEMAAIEEAKLGESVGFLPKNEREEVVSWWLAVRGRANTPNWDIASTCTIRGKLGLLLVEAKAHRAELKPDGKTLSKNVSAGSEMNQKQICSAIRAASAGLETAMQGWKLSCESHYQLANRFAWSWKFASIGRPIVLVYLGFLGAKEMSGLGEPFTDQDHWSHVVLEYSRNIVPNQAWGRDLNIGSVAIRPLIRSCEHGLPTVT